MADLEGFRRLLNPLVLNLQKMELELTCPICLKLFSMPRLLPCNHISCSPCVTTTKHGYDCPICKVPFHHQDLKPAAHVEVMVNIYKSMTSTIGAIHTRRGEQVAISDTKIPSGESPDFGDRNDEEKFVEEPIHYRAGEGSRYMQSHAPIFGNFRTGNPRCEGDNNDPAMNVSKKDGQNTGMEAFLKEKGPCTPQSSSDQKDSDYDSNDLGNEPRNGSDSCKRGSNFGSSQTGEDYVRESKRQKLHNLLDGGDIVGDVNAKEFSAFNSELVREHQRCPNIKSLHTTDHGDTNGLVNCAFCHSFRTTEASGPMLHYNNGKPVADDQALQLNVLHVHQKCIEWAPQVFFAGETAVNLEAELARASKIKCTSCGLKGAALGCYVKSCRRSYHVPCAVDIGDCRWDAENFLLLCPVHFSHKLPCDRSKARKKTKANHSLCYSNSPCDLTSPAKQWSDKLWTASPSVTREWLLCSSSLSNMDKDILNDFVSLTGAVATNSWKPNITHVIAATDEHGACSRTLKVLMAILGGKWVLNVEWLRACMKAGHPVPEEPHEISHDIHGAFDGPRNGRIRAMQKAPKLFTGITFYFSGHFMPYYKDHLEDLILTAGGTVLEESEITPTTFIVYSTEPPQGSNSVDQHEVIKKRKEEAEDLAAKIGSRVIPHTWLLDSIASCNVQLNL